MKRVSHLDVELIAGRLDLFDTNWSAGMSGSTNRKVFAPAAFAADTPPMPIVTPLTDE